MHDEITVVCFGVKYFKYMFRVRGPPMAQMFARLVELWVAAPARSNDVSKRGFPEASTRCDYHWKASSSIAVLAAPAQ